MDAVIGVLTIFGCFLAVAFIGVAFNNAKRASKQEERSALSGLDWVQAAIEDTTDWIGAWPQFDGIAMISRCLVANLRRLELETISKPESCQGKKLTFSKEDSPAKNSVETLWNLFGEAMSKLSGDTIEMKGIGILLEQSSRKFASSSKSFDYTRVFVASTILLYCALIGIMKGSQSSDKRYEISNRLSAFENGFAYPNYRGLHS